MIHSPQDSRNSTGAMALLCVGLYWDRCGSKYRIMSAFDERQRGDAEATSGWGSGPRYGGRWGDTFWLSPHRDMGDTRWTTTLAIRLARQCMGLFWRPRFLRHIGVWVRQVNFSWLRTSSCHFTPPAAFSTLTMIVNIEPETCFVAWCRKVVDPPLWRLVH